MLPSNSFAATKVYTDLHSLQSLAGQAKQHEGKVLNEVAQQFEAIFVQLAIKSMRNANNALKSDLFNSNQAEFYQDMYDKQLALHLTGKGVGLAKSLAEQLKQIKGGPEVGASASSSEAEKSKDALGYLLSAAKKHAKNHILPGGMKESIVLPKPQETGVKNNSKENQSEIKTHFKSPLSFLKGLWDEAKKAASALGVDPKVVLAQAALESDWGRRVIKHPDGKSSHNLFGIKTGSSWTKDKVTVTTTEFYKGAAKKIKDEFRSYQSFAQSFMDYVNLIKNNPRYREVINNASNPLSYAEELQKAGYATDPNYAKKIIKVMESDVFKSFFKLD